jgi:hypothetical protein
MVRSFEDDEVVWSLIEKIIFTTRSVYFFFWIETLLELVTQTCGNLSYFENNDLVAVI